MASRKMAAGEPVGSFIARGHAELAVRAVPWDDEVVPRESGLALFDAFASREKTLPANTGRHVAVPASELDSSERFFARHLAVVP
jgi:hypothetical protein